MFGELLKLSDKKKLSDEELLQALDSAEPAIEMPTKSPLDFLKVFNIQPGDKLLLRDYLYKVYSKWTDEKVVYRAKFYEELSSVLKYNNPFFLTNVGSKEFKANFIDPFKKFKPKVKKLDKKIGAFMQRYDIKPGKQPLEGFLLYYLYDKYLYERGYTTPAEKYFNETLKAQNILNHDKSMYGPVYYVHASLLKHFTESEVKNVRESRRKAQDKARKAKIR